MKLGIVHLSDCHIDDGTEPVLARIQEIASTVRAFKKADGWVIIFSGDISNKGFNTQVERGALFLKEIESAIRNITSVDIKIVVIPGNHDCNIPIEAKRQELTDKIRTGKLVEKEVLLEAQSAFWTTFPITDTIPCNSKMTFISRFEVGGQTVAIIGANSSWMSDLHEKQGGIQFQPEWFDPIAAWIYQNEPHLVIAAIHHPIHWQKEGVQKPLWHKLNKVTDVLLTGHEHQPDEYVRHSGNSTIGVFEGGVLSQSNNYEHCDFQILLIDTQQGTLEKAVCSWERTRGEFTVQRENRQFRQNIGRAKNAFRDEWLAEIEISLLEACHSRKNPVRLSDYFVWPHTRRTDRTKQTELKQKTISEFLELLREKKYLRITGGIKSGKTALLRHCVPFLKQNGFTPILIDAAECETANKAIKAALATQYVDLTLDSLHAAKNTILLIDNWERLRLRLDKRLEFIEELLQISSYCIMTTSVSTDVEYLSSGRTSMLDAFQDLTIEPLTRSKRSEILLRWALIAAPLEVEEEDLERAVEQGNDKISTILGENLVPATPLITIMLWRELESGVTTTQGVGSSGHLYKHLIEYSLTHSKIKSTEVGWDQRYSFLGFLAIAMFRKKAVLARADVEIVKDDFMREICLQSDLDSIMRDCTNLGMLKMKDDTVCFAYEFGLYYFTAYYLHEHREVESVQIQEMVKNMYAFENMQTITFYLYLSSDAAVMSNILEIAETFQEKADEFSFEHLPIANRTLTEAVKPRLIKENSEDRPSFDSVVAKSKTHDADVRDIILARRLSYVLGQVVSNFPAKVASRIGAERRDNFLKQAYRLELVALANSLKLLTTNAAEFLDHLRYHISHDPSVNASAQEQTKILHKAIPALLHFMVVQSVLEIPSRLCSKDLLSVHDKIAELNGPRNRVYSVINTAICIDQSSTYPTSLVLEKSKEFAKAKDGSWNILRDVVYFSLLKFKRIYKVRQRMCQEFEFRDNAQMLLEEA